MKCVTRQNGDPIANREAPRLSNVRTKVIGIMHRDPSIVAVVKSAIDFSPAFEKSTMCIFSQLGR